MMRQHFMRHFSIIRVIRLYFQPEYRKTTKKIPQGIAILVGFIRANKSKKGRPYFNSVALIQKGKKTQFFDKQIINEQ